MNNPTYGDKDKDSGWMQYESGFIEIDEDINMTDPWPTYCEQVEGWSPSKCCGSCHDEAYEYGIEPCDVVINGKTLFVCCKCWEWVQNDRVHQPA